MRVSSGWGFCSHARHSLNDSAYGERGASVARTGRENEKRSLEHSVPLRTLHNFRFEKRRPRLLTRVDEGLVCPIRMIRGQTKTGHESRFIIHAPKRMSRKENMIKMKDHVRRWQFRWPAQPEQFSRCFIFLERQADGRSSCRAHALEHVFVKHGGY